MATNYTVGQAVEIIVRNDNPERVAEIAKRFPKLAVLAAKIGASGNAEDFIKFATCMPKYTTALKVQRQLDAYDAGELEVEALEDDEAEEPKEEKPATKKTAKKTAKKPAKKVEEPEEAEDDEAEEAGEYDGMTAPELFKLCKKRGIKVAPKKPKNVYVKALEEADAAGDDGEDEDEDWDI